MQVLCIFSTNLTLGIRTTDLHSIICSRRPVVSCSDWIPPTQNHGPPMPPPNWKCQNRHCSVHLWLWWLEEWRRKRRRKNDVDVWKAHRITRCDKINSSVWPLHTQLHTLPWEQTDRAAQISPLYSPKASSRSLQPRNAGKSSCGFGNWLRTIGLCAFNEFSVVTAEIRIKVGLLVWFCRRSCGCLGFKALVNYNQLCAQYHKVIKH